MGGPNSLDPASSSSRNSSSPAVLPQACSQVLEYVAGSRDVYDVQLKVRVEGSCRGFRGGMRG
jgi:hypothetical protein